MDLARLLQLAGRLDEDAAATVASLMNQGNKAGTEVGHLVQKAMTEIAEIGTADLAAVAETLLHLSNDLGDLLDGESFIAMAVRAIKTAGADDPMVQRVLTNIIVPTAKKYVTHPQSEAMWAKLVAKA